MSLEKEELYSACEEGDLKKVKVIVKSNPEIITADNNNPVWLASRNGHLEIVKFLVTGDLEPGNKADITADNNSAVHMAGCFGELETVKFLLPETLNPETRRISLQMLRIPSGMPV